MVKPLHKTLQIYITRTTENNSNSVPYCVLSTSIFSIAVSYLLLSVSGLTSTNASVTSLMNFLLIFSKNDLGKVQ